MPSVRVVANISANSPAAITVLGPGGAHKVRHRLQQLDVVIARITPIRSFRRTESIDAQEFTFDVRFVNDERIQAAAFVHALQEVSITQHENNYVRIDLRHSRLPAQQTQCRVVCKTSGKSNEGPHPCLECTVGGVTVRLCC